MYGENCVADIELANNNPAIGYKVIRPNKDIRKEKETETETAKQQAGREREREIDETLNEPF
jgi:hypothetical protein